MLFLMPLIGLLGHQDTQILLHRAAPQQVNPQALLLSRVFLSHMQDPAFAFDEFWEVLLCPSLQPVEMPLKDCTAPWGIGQICVLSGLTEGTSVPSLELLVELDTSFGPLGAPLETGLQTDTVTLVMSPWDWHLASSQSTSQPTHPLHSS